MAAPVLGGLLVADEVIDVFLPVLYFAVQKRRWAETFIVKGSGDRAVSDETKRRPFFFERTKRCADRLKFDQDRGQCVRLRLVPEALLAGCTPERMM